MPSLISQRPKDWNQIVGQDRVVRILQAALRNPKFMVRGFIFRGPYGVGKTTVAYILARALLCKGADPLGCGKCQSCRIIDSGGIDQHADFYEVDAASTTTDPKFKSGVEAAHEILAGSTWSPAAGPAPFRPHRQSSLADRTGLSRIEGRTRSGPLRRAPLVGLVSSRLPGNHGLCFPSLGAIAPQKKTSGATWSLP